MWDNNGLCPCRRQSTPNKGLTFWWSRSTRPQPFTHQLRNTGINDWSEKHETNNEKFVLCVLLIYAFSVLVYLVWTIYCFWLMLMWISHRFTNSAIKQISVLTFFNCLFYMCDCVCVSSMNRMSSLPRGFGSLPALEVLDLTYNNLNESSLPGNFFYLSESFYVCHTHQHTIHSIIIFVDFGD